MKAWLALVLLTVISAVGDSRGFIWSDRAWASGSLDWRALGYALIGYGIGIGSWFLAVKYIKQLGGLGVSAQTTGWFLLTILGVAVATGEFLQWSLLDKALAVVCILCFSLLIHRTSL